MIRTEGGDGVDDLVNRLLGYTYDWNGSEMPDDAPALTEASCGLLREAALRIRAMAAAIEQIIPSNVALGNDNWPDSTILPLDVKLGELRQARAALKATPPQGDAT